VFSQYGGERNGDSGFTGLTITQEIDNNNGGLYYD
jgi:hypothetical protein